MTGPVDESKNQLPDILCVIQVCIFDQPIFLLYFCICRCHWLTCLVLPSVFWQNLLFPIFSSLGHYNVCWYKLTIGYLFPLLGYDEWNCWFVSCDMSNYEATSLHHIVETVILILILSSARTLSCIGLECMKLGVLFV